MELRSYQTEALDALFAYWAEGGDGALIELATGTGKSLVMAEMARRLVTTYSDFRIIAVAHVQELIGQNHDELLNLWLAAPAGIYSAGLNRRDRSQITFCGIQSVYNKAELFGHVDLLLVDEAHLIGRKAGTMYGQFIAALRQTNPDMRIVGLTATPYRLSSGRLDEGEDRLFERTVYTYGIADGVRDGYLARLVTKATETLLDVTGVQKRGGEYVESQLQSAVDKEAVTNRAVDEVVTYGRDRNSWLAFCSGVDHAYHVRDEIRRRGFGCETVVGNTGLVDRQRILGDFKSGRIRCLTNANVLTTGFNAPNVDMIIALRPTASPGLYIQQMGRGTRCAHNKNNCLVLDFAGLIRTHGPVDAVKARTPGKGDGVAPVKECPTCHSLIHASLRECPDCGHVFEPCGETKLTAKASAMAIMADAPATWLAVTGRTFAPHYKPDKPTSVLARYRCGFVTHKAWYGPEHNGKMRAAADKFWLEHGGSMPVPRTADAWLDREAELRATEQIAVKPDGKYFRVDATKAAPALAFV